MKAPLADACACVTKGCACAPVKVIGPGYEDPRYLKSRGIVQLDPSANASPAERWLASMRPGEDGVWRFAPAASGPKVVGPGTAERPVLGALREAYEARVEALWWGASYAVTTTR